MEGQIWESAMLAPKYNLDTLVAILDHNKMALSGPVTEIMPLAPVTDKWRAFGWHVIEIDGHSVKEIISALDEAKSIKGKPTMIIAHTIKGKGMPEIENKWQSHAITDFSSDKAKELVENLSCDL